MKKIFSLFSVLGIVLLICLSASPAFAADTTSPSDVENISVTPLNGSVRLTWDEALDDVGVEGYHVHYGTTSVSEPEQTYDDFIDVGDVLEYTVTGLENDTLYYFSVVAYDAVGNESLSWAIEQSATPSEDLGTPEDTDAPQVAEATALNKEEVEVVFSEAIILPEEDPQDVFMIENDDTFEALLVLDAVMDEEDETNKTVILTTVEQEEDAPYLLTVGIDIEDNSGNSIISGTSDTAIFTGSGEEKPIDDLDGPQLVSVESMDDTHVLVTFNETVVLSIDPSEDFEIVQENDATKSLSVLGVELGVSSDGVEDASAIVTTSAQENVSYILTAMNLTDEAGNDVNPSVSSIIFNGVAGEENGGEEPGPADTTPPQDVSEILAEYVEENGSYILTLTWELLEENMGEVAQQILYMSITTDTDYTQKAGLGADINDYEFENLEAGEYWIKLTQEDAAGNESEGTFVKVVLSETGPEMLGLLLVSVGLGRVFRKKRRK